MGVDNENNFKNWRNWNLKDWAKLVWASIIGMLQGC